MPLEKAKELHRAVLPKAAAAMCRGERIELIRTLPVVRRENRNDPWRIDGKEGTWVYDGPARIDELHKQTIERVMARADGGWRASWWVRWRAGS